MMNNGDRGYLSVVLRLCIVRCGGVGVGYSIGDVVGVVGVIASLCVKQYLSSMDGLILGVSTLVGVVVTVVVALPAVCLWSSLLLSLLKQLRERPLVRWEQSNAGRLHQDRCAKMHTIVFKL